MKPFPCNRCGRCCCNVHHAKETQFLDRGDGCCQYYDVQTKLCKIYEKRPSICRVDEQYKINYAQLMSWEQFTELNLVACQKIFELYQ